MVTVDARPEPMVIDPSRTAVVVVDMQNEFGAEGGIFHRAGVPLDGIRAVIPPTARVLEAARGAGIQVVYLKTQFEPDRSDMRGFEAPNLLVRCQFIGEWVQAPDGSESRILIRDTWNTEIVAELAPEEGDLVVPKHHFSGFFETELDAKLNALGVTALVFTGCTTSVCVESTLRDALFRGYRCLLLEDCVAEVVGADLERTNHDASVYLVETQFGWVSGGAAFEAALEQPTAVAATA